MGHGLLEEGQCPDRYEAHLKYISNLRWGSDIASGCRILNLCTERHFITKKIHVLIFLRQMKRITHKNFSVCLLTTISFYYGNI